jgi:DNA polymerase
MKKVKFDDYIKNSPLYEANKKTVLYRGAENPKILFIGEAPGKEENKVGKPFVGRCGKLLDKWISHFNLTEICGITNAVPLIPLDSTGQNIRKPTFEEINYFRPFVKAMLNKYKPTLLILLGDSATNSLIRRSIGEMKFQLIQKGDYKITAIYHPSYYLRNGRDGLDDFQKLYETVINKILEK